NRDKGAGSLRSAIRSAHPGDTIDFAADLSGQTITLKSQIRIDKPLDIEGLGADELTLSGHNSHRIFDITSSASAVTINNLILENGHAKQGGAIFDDGSSLTLISDSFNKNRAVFMALGAGTNGGALFVLGESTTDMTVNISNCQFNDDVARGTDAGTDAAGNV